MSNILIILVIPILLIHTNISQQKYFTILSNINYVSIRTNMIDTWINFIEINNNVNLSELLNDDLNIYINDIFKKGKEYVKETFDINNLKIVQYQQPCVFFQSNHDIRVNIYNYIHNKYNCCKKIVLFGGEFYIYSQLFPNLTHIEAYTDCKKLYNNALYNNPHFNVKHINYNNYKILSLDAVDLIIIQVSPTGLKPNLLKQILQVKTKYVVYIGCKPQIVDRDIMLLKKHIISYNNFDNNVFLVDLTDLFEIPLSRQTITQKHQIVSIGGECSVAYQLKKFNYRFNSFPFDWIKSSMSDVYRLLVNNFNQFIDMQFIKFKKSSDNFKFIVQDDDNIKNIEYGNIYVHSLYSIHFCHDFDDDKKSNSNDVINKYQRRISKLKQLMDSQLCVFVRYESEPIDYNLLELWNSNRNIPTIIISSNCDKTQFITIDTLDIHRFSPNVTIIKDNSVFDNWQRNNFPWRYYLIKLCWANIHASNQYINPHSSGTFRITDSYHIKLNPKFI